MDNENFLETLRRETGPIHKQIEETGISRLIISPALNTTQYSLYLQRLLQLHQDVEKFVFPVLTNYIPDIAEREKSGMIFKDLLNLIASPQKDITGFIDQDFKTNPDFCMGMLYVSEGSTLGYFYS